VNKEEGVGAESRVIERGSELGGDRESAEEEMKETWMGSTGKGCTGVIAICKDPVNEREARS